MVTIPLGNSDWRRNLSQSPYIRLRNRFFEQNPANQVEGSALLARPALARWINAGSGPNRGGPYSQPGSFNDSLFVLSGRELYQIDVAGNPTLLGSGFFASDDFTTRASMAATAAIGSTPERLFIADGKQLQVYQASTYARGELLATGAVANTDVVRIDGSYYRFTNGSVNAGTPAGTSGNPWLVALGADTRTSFSNLLKAVNASGVAGTIYSTALTANASAVATGSTATELFVRASVLGTAGNSIVTTETGANIAWGAATLTGAVNSGLSIVDVPDGLAAISVAFIAGYVIVVPAPSEGFKGRFYWIEPGAVTINALNFATAERSPDPIVSVRAVGDQFALFGTTATEMWYPTGDLLAPFARSQGRVFERGVWEGSDVQIKDTLVLMDTDGVIYRIDGGGPQRISDNSVEERTRAAIKLAVTQTAPDPGPTPGALSVTLSTTGATDSSANSFTTFTPVLATATGGTAPYSHRFFWTNRSGGTFAFTGDNFQPLVTPSVSSVANSVTASAALQCEVTDALGTVVTSAAAPYTFTNTLSSGVTPPPNLPSFTVGVSYTFQFFLNFNQSSLTFPSLAATPSGGTGPYTYSCYIESSAGGSFTVTTPEAAATTVSVDYVDPGQTAVAVVRYRVTDSLGAYGVSDRVSLYYTNQINEGEFIP